MFIAFWGSVGCCFHTCHQLSKVRGIVVDGDLNLTFDCCRFEYIRMLQRDDSLWESFPRVLEGLAGA